MMCMCIYLMNILHVWSMFIYTFYLFSDIDECSSNHGCSSLCTNTEGSFYCTCEDGYRIANDGSTCLPVCGGSITMDCGSISSPGWPNSYPALNYTCEWTIETRNNTIVDFSIVEPFGIRGNPPCTRDYVEITCIDLSGDICVVTSLGKMCSISTIPDDLSTPSNIAIVTFHASPAQFGQNVGFNLTFTAIEKGMCIHEWAVYTV